MAHSHEKVADQEVLRSHEKEAGREVQRSLLHKPAWMAVDLEELRTRHCESAWKKTEEVPAEGRSRRRTGPVPWTGTSCSVPAAAAFASAWELLRLRTCLGYQNTWRC